MKIIIETIPHSQQRYDTVGDYWTDAEGTDHITVSSMGNRRFEFLVALHELVEAELCKARGISDETITAFDLQHLEESGLSDTGPEPGDDPRAPYVKEHCFATGIERLMCAELGLAWSEYDKTVANL